MFPNRYFEAYNEYKYDRNRLWIFEQTQSSYWTKNASVKDYRAKGYMESNEDDNKIIENKLRKKKNEIDIIARFKSECIDYAHIPFMSHLLSLKSYQLSHHSASQILLSISRCLDIRAQIALNRRCKHRLKDAQNERNLSDKNSISESELDDISSIIEIGIKSNYAMLNAVYTSSQQPNKAIIHKILSVLTNLLYHLGPLSLKNKSFDSLQQLLIELCSNTSIDIQYPLQSLLALTLCTATLDSTIHTIDAIFNAVFKADDGNKLKMKVPQCLYDLIQNAFGITLESPNKQLLSDSFHISLSVPTPFKENILDSISSKEDEKQKEKPQDDVDDEKEEKTDRNKEKKILESKRKAIEKRLTDFIAIPTGGALTSYREYLIYLNEKGLHKIGTGYNDTNMGEIYCSLKDIHLSNDNIAWMTTWNNKDYQWILIRFRYDINANNDDGYDKLCGKIYVIDADTFVILGCIHSDGKGSIKTEDNTAHLSLGRMTTSIGPIFVNQETNRLYAFIFEESIDDICSLKVQRFELPILKYIEGDIELYGASNKTSNKTLMDAPAFGWGQNGSGGLGINETSSKYSPTPLQLLPKVRMDSCFAGNETSFFVSSSGSVYAHGRNGSGQLGLGKGNKSNQLKPQLITGLNGHQIIKISGSRHGSHTVFLSDKGKVFCAGNNGNGQVKTANEHAVADVYCINDNDEELIKITKKKGKKWLFFIDIAAACNRTAAVTKTGELYGWGNNNRRSMGLDGEQAYRHPTLEKRLIEKLKVKLVRIDMGHSFSLALDSKGDAYTVGDGGNGQLGLGNTQSKTEWTKIEVDHKWKDITCGYYHGMGIVKTKDGTTPLYVWGNGQNGQLGLGTRAKNPSPVLNTAFKKSERIAFIQGGGFFSGCLTVNGDVYIWGSNSYGEQGQGDTTSRPQPTKVTTDGFDEEKIRCLAVGYYHCLAIPENRDPPIERNTLHGLRWYNAPKKIGCLHIMREKKKHNVTIYDENENRIAVSKEIDYTNDDEIPIDITYNAYNHSVYAVYAHSDDHLMIRRWMNGVHLDLSVDKLIWESEYFVTHPDYLLNTTDASLVSVAVNLIAGIDLMIKSKLIDPYTPHSDLIEEWKYLYDGSSDKRTLTLFARCLCISHNENVFQFLIKYVISSWNTLKNIWILRDCDDYSMDDILFRARIYVLIALFRILSFNVKLFSVKVSGSDGAQNRLKGIGDELFGLLSDVRSTVERSFEGKKGNSVEQHALNTIKQIAQQIFTYAFNVFYASWNGRAQFLMTLIEDIHNQNVDDVSFKRIGVENIFNLSEIHHLYTVTKKENKLYEYIKDKKEEKEDGDDEDEDGDVITPRHNVMDALLQFIIAPDIDKLNASKQDTNQDINDIRALILKIITLIQMGINNKVAFDAIKTQGKRSNASKIIILSLKIITESNVLLRNIMQHKDKEDIINNSDLLQHLLPAAIHSFHPLFKRLRPEKHKEIFVALNELNEVLNVLNKERGVAEEKERENADDIMVIESDHPYIPTHCKRYAAEFGETVHAVTIRFDVRCRFRATDDQLTIGFPENPNYFHGSMTHNVPGTIIVPSNKIYINFASYGSASLRKADPPADALQKWWGFRLYLKPHILLNYDYLYKIQMTLCDLLATIACDIVFDRNDIQSKLSLQFPSPAELYSSNILKNGLETTDDGDDSKQDVEVQSFVYGLLTEQKDDALMDKVRKAFSSSSAVHSVVIDDMKSRTDIFGGIPSEIAVQVFNKENEALKSVNAKTCCITARLFKKTERKPREEERDWMKEVIWNQYDRKVMDYKLTQFAMCYDGDDSIYIMGGYKEGNVDSKDCYQYSLKENKYTKIKHLDFAVKCHCIGMLNDGRILSMGGNTSHLALYDPISNQWDYSLNTQQNKKHFGSGSRFVIIENKEGEAIVHCIGGSKYTEEDDEEKKDDNENNGGDKHWIYNMNTNEWKLMGKRCPTKVKYHGLICDAYNRIYCFGGKPNGEQMHCFDIDKNEWYPCPDIPVNICSFGACLDANKRYILLCGGSDTVQPHSGPFFNHVYIYDTYSGVWKKSDQNVPYGVKNARCIVIGKTCHMFGGSNGSPLNKHSTGVAKCELKEDSEIKYYQHKDATDDLMKWVQKETRFEVKYDNDLAKITWIPFVHGIYLVDILMDGHPIKHSPYVMNVRPITDLCMEQSNVKDMELLDEMMRKLNSDKKNKNEFKMPSNALFVYDASNGYSVEFIKYIETLEYEWQKHVEVEVDMPLHYGASLSTGIYGFYTMKELEIVDDVCMIMPARYCASYNCGVYGMYMVENETYSRLEIEEENKMPNHYKASYHSGVYGCYILKGMPLSYKASYNSGIYGVYVVEGQVGDGYCDGSETEEEEEDTFNALFKEMEKHSTYKKNADVHENEDNLDTNVTFGGVKPKKLMIDGVRIDLSSGPCLIDLEEKEKEEEEENDICEAPITSLSADKAIKCVFLVFIKHLGLSDTFYKWSRDEDMDHTMVDLMANIWKYACVTAYKILREREDFPLEQREIKVKKDWKNLLKEFRKTRKEWRNSNENKEKEEKEEKKDADRQDEKDADHQDEKDADNQEKKDADHPDEKERKIFKGVCKLFDADGGFAIITVENKDELKLDEIKVDQSEIFAENHNKTLQKGEKVEFEVMEDKDGKIGVCCTGMDGKYVLGMNPEKKKKKKPQIIEHDFDGFKRGYNHLYKQCDVLVSIRNSKEMDPNHITSSNFDDIMLCKSIHKILSLDESIEKSEVNLLISDRTKLALQKEKAYHMFCELFVANDVSQELYLIILWYFCKSLSLFSFATESKYRNKPQIFEENLDDNIKQHKYTLSNTWFKSHYLSNIDGVNVHILSRLSVLFWNIIKSAINKEKETHNISLQHQITNLLCMDWRNNDFDLFKQWQNQSMIQYLYTLSSANIKIDENISFWNEDIFKKHIYDVEMVERKGNNEDENNIIREELASLTWFCKLDLDESLFVSDEDKSLRLNVHTLKEKEKYKLFGQGTSPLIVNGVEFEGEYRPYDDDHKGNIDLMVKCCNNELFIDVASWSNTDAVKDGFNKSHIKVNDGNNKQTLNYGVHFALINLFNGGYVKYKYFDIHSSANNVKPLIEYVADLPKHHLIIITTYYNSGKHWTKEIYDALKVYGWKWRKIEEYESFIFIANTDSSVYYSEKKGKGHGPVKKELFIPMYPTPNIRINGYFVDKYTVNATWNLQDIASVWRNYMWDSKVKDKEQGVIEFTVSKELEDGWKWNETQDIKQIITPFYSYLAIPNTAYTMDVSSNKNSLKNVNDHNFESYWQSSSSSKKHWISFELKEYASFSGISIYFNYQKDANNVAEILKVHIGIDNKEESCCVVTRCVQREFKGIYVLDIDQIDINDDDDADTLDLKNKIVQNENRYIKCKYIKVEWFYETQSKYARIRQIFLYSNKINQFDEKINSCFIKNDKWLTAEIWKTTNLLRELEMEYDDDWIKNKEKKCTKTTNNGDVKHTHKNKKNEAIPIEDSSGALNNLFGGDSDDEYSDDDW